MSTTALRPTDELPPATPPRRKRTALLVVAVVAVLAVVATWLIAFSPVFGVRTITVRGTHLLTAAQVRTAAHLSHGTPLVRVDAAAITKRVEQLPEVASAQVSTSFPSTVVITVDERTPVGYLRKGNDAVLVDRTGDQYRTVRKPEKGLPRFVVASGAAGRATGAAVAEVAAALPPALRREVVSITALSPTSITLLLTQGRVVQWGSAVDSAQKALLLPVLLRRHPAQVDLTNPAQPFTRGSG